MPQDSPRALVKQGRMDEARDVIDMLSLESDPAKRSEETVCFPTDLDAILLTAASRIPACHS